ncbi:MAG: hypothetical protein Q9213_005584 [Squamulea squamosa]
MEKSGPPPYGNIDLGPGLIASTVVLVAVSAIVVALRIATRWWIVKSVGWDDITIVLAILGTIIGASLDFVEVHYGFGRPAWYLTDHQIREFLKYTYGEWIQTFASLMWTKISICLFLMRIPVSKAYIRPLQAGVVILVVSNVILTLLWILQCSPVSAAWDLELKKRSKCFSKGQLQRVIIAQAIISVVSDFVFAAFPILILRKLQMKLRTKIAIAMLMGLGVITGACCIVRTVLNFQSLPKDFTYGGIPNWYWRLFEVQLGIIAACIPALRPGYKWMQTKIQTYISSHTKLSHTRFSKKQPRAQHIEEAKTARHLQAHPANVYSDPPMLLRSGNTTMVGSLGSREMELPPNLYVQDSTVVDVESQRKIGSQNSMNEEPEESKARQRPSLEVDLRPRHQAPEAIHMTFPTSASFKRELSDDTHMLLQQMAQKGSSQAEENATTPGHQRHEEEPASIALDDHALVNGHTPPFNDGQTSSALNGVGIGNSDQSMVLPAGVEAQHWDLNYEDLTHPDRLHNSLNLTQANIQALGDDPILEATTSPVDVESEPPRVSAFAKLEFDDGEFYMNTYSVELGRDTRAARQASENHFQAVQRASGSSRKRSSSSGNASGSSSKKIKSEDGRHLSGNMVSENGGVVAMDHPGSEPTGRRKGRKSKSATSSPRQLSRKSSMTFAGLHTDYQSLALASLSDPLPSPESCPLVPIHPPSLNDGIPISHKSISRKHVKIAFNFEKHLFELTVMGRNGAFVDEEWFPAGDTQPLRSGSLIQIGGVGIRFLLPDVALGETGAGNNLNSDPASFELDTDGVIGDLEDSNDDGSDEPDEADESRDDSDDDKSDESDDQSESEKFSEEERRGRPREPKPTLANRPVRNRKPVHGKEPTKTKAPPKTKRPEKLKLKLKTKKEPTPEPIAPPPKRKGPGRPPKNGIISKRAQAELARQAREAAKGGGKKGDADAKPGRGKGKSIPLAEVKQERSNLQPNGKRKYKKRKSKADMEAGEQQNIRESTEHTDIMPPEQNAAPAPPPKPPKPIKPPKPPRSPSPVFDVKSLTPEQLAKPQDSYVVLIHEALSNSKTGQMSLPQIYRAIERKYPFFKVRVQTTGWQSSVRHNLSQHAAFGKIERDGKGWLWGIVAGVSIEKERKRRITPPPMPAEGYYSTPQMMPPSYSYPMPYPPYATYPGVSMGQRPPYPPAPPHYAPQPTTSALPPALANAVDTTSTYQSPYATGPPAQPAPPPQPSQQAANADGSVPPTAPSKPQDTLAINKQPQPSIPNAHNSTPHPIPTSSAPFPYASSQPPLPRLQQLLAQQTPDVAHVVQKFKTYLLESMADNPSAESLIDSAIHRVLSPNSPPPNNLSATKERQTAEEKAITGILQGMLDNLRKKGTNGYGTGNGEDRGGGGRDKMFFQILEKVNEKNDGSLPLPREQPVVVMKEEQAQREPNTGEEKGRSAESAEPRANGVMVEEVPRKETSMIEKLDEAPRGVKRFLGDDVEGAMDQGPREAKRVAT